MRDLMVLGAMLILIPLSLRSTFSAYMLWGWAGLIALPSYLYGFMLGVPFVQVFALLTLFLLLIKKDKEIAGFKSNTTTILLVILGLQCLVSAFFAYPNLARNWELCRDMLKTLLFCLLMPMLITTRYRFHAFLLMVAIALSFHGLIDGLKFIASGGGHRSHGVSKFGDNNHFALLLCMCLPLLIYAYQYGKFRLIRLGFAGVFLVTSLAIVATGSRGALLTLAAVAGWLILQSRRKFLGIVIVTLVGSVILAAAPATWTERMSTIDSAGIDSSFMGRVAAWKRASAIALENPLTGGGLQSGQDPIIYQQFEGKQGLLGFVNTSGVISALATHSIYFQAMGDLGFMGFFLFLTLMLSPFFIRLQICQLAKKIGPDANWARDCSDMLTASMVAYLVGGAALSATYFELPYLVVMMMQVLYMILHANRASSR